MRVETGRKALAIGVSGPSYRRAPATGRRRSGSGPLAVALFADPLVRRGPFEYARLDRRHSLWKRARALLGVELPALWARMGGEEAEARRQERMAPFIESVGVDGTFEVIEEIRLGE